MKKKKTGDTKNRKGEDGMKILDSKFMKGFIKMADDGFQQCRDLQESFSW